MCVRALHAKSVLTHTKDMFFKRYRMADFCVNLFAKVPFLSLTPLTVRDVRARVRFWLSFCTVMMSRWYFTILFFLVDGYRFMSLFWKVFTLVRWAIVGVTANQMKFWWEVCYSWSQLFTTFSSREPQTSFLRKPFPDNLKLDSWESTASLPRRPLQ